MASESLDSSIVLFFFAHEKLLFRCPVENPFLIDVATATSAPTSNPLNPSLSSASSSNSAPVPGGGALAAKSQSKRAPAPPGPLADPLGRPEPAVEAVDRGSDGNANKNSNSSAVAAVGLAARHKKKSKRPVDEPVAASPLGQGGGTRLRRPTATAAAPPPVPPQGGAERARGAAAFGGGGPWGGPERSPVAATCVGISVNSLLHLLRAPFRGFTTINLTNCTLLVLPLTAADGRATPEASGANLPMAAAHKRGRASTAMLVAAMRRPDTDSGTISRFLQCFMNILYREEQRAQYVSKQIKVMQHLLSEWERGRAESQGGASSNTPSMEQLSPDHHTMHSGTAEESNAPTVGRGSSTSASGSAGTTDPMRQSMFSGPSGGSADRFTYLAEHPKATLCVTIAQLAHSINAWCATIRAVECRLPCYSPNTAAHSFLRSHPGGGSNANQHVASAPSSPPLLSGDIIIKDVLRLPLSFLTGIAPRPQHISSIYFSLNPHSLLRLNPACSLLLSELENEYVEALGRRHARLFPLSAVQACLARLSTPWRIGALKKSLERALVKINKTRRSALSRPPQQQRTDGAANQPAALEAPGTSHLYTGSEKDAHATASVALPQALNLDFLAVDIVEFLQAQGVILVDREFNVSFTHGDVISVHAISKQYSKIVQHQLKLYKNLQTTSAPYLTPPQRADASATNQRTSHGKQGGYAMLPSILLLNMLMLLLANGRERSRLTGGDSTDVPPYASNTELNAKSASNMFTISPKTHLGSDANVSTTASNAQLISGPLKTSAKGPQHTVAPQLISPAAAVSEAAERHELVAYCAWGSTCTLCEALAANPQCWLLCIDTNYGCGGGSCPAHSCASATFEVPVTIHFPFLDHSVRVCARHEAKRHRPKVSKHTGPLSDINSGGGHRGTDGIARFSSQHGSSSLGTTRMQVQRPWFLKPEMYMGPLDLHKPSSYKVFKQLTSSNVAASSHRVSLGITTSTSSKAYNMPERTGDRACNEKNPYLPGQLNADKGEGCLLLSAESIPMEAKAWLHRFASIIAGRVEHATERQRQLEHQLTVGLLVPVNGNENSDAGANGVLHGLHPTACRASKEAGKAHAATHGSSVVRSASDRACGMEIERSRTVTSGASQHPLAASCPPASAPVCVDSHAMRYTKRRLPDCNAARPVSLVEYPLLASGKSLGSVLLPSHQEQANELQRQPKNVSKRGLYADLGPLGGHDQVNRSSNVPCTLGLPNRQVPVKVLLIVVMHHLVAFTWGKSEVDVEMLVRLLERNLRRLPPLISNLVYALYLMDAGWNSKILGSILKVGGKGFALHDTIVNYTHDAKLTKNRDSVSFTKSEEADGNTIDSTSSRATMPGECISSLASRTKFTPTLVDYQLLMALEAYDALSLLPVIRIYANLLVEPVPTRLLLHTVVNEFSDVFFIGGSKGGRYGEQVNNACAL